MRQTLLAAATAFVIGGIATGAVLSHAQPAAPPAPQMDGAPPPPAMGPAMGWGHHMMRHGMHGGHKFALIYREQDRNLTPADVRKIAEAFLLWNGNHTWKIANVTPTTDGPIGFNLETPEGSVVAKFTMDPHTGHIHRNG